MRTRQGLGGHIRFRHLDVKAPANRRPRRETAFETETKAQIQALSESLRSLTTQSALIGFIVLHIAEGKVDLNRVGEVRGRLVRALLDNSGPDPLRLYTPAQGPPPSTGDAPPASKSAKSGQLAEADGLPRRLPTGPVRKRQPGSRYSNW